MNRIARAVVDLSGEKPSTASHLKIICNVIIVHLIEAIAEAHVLAEKTGLKVECLTKALGTVWGGPYGLYSERMASGDYYTKEVSSLVSPLASPVCSRLCHFLDGLSED